MKRLILTSLIVLPFASSATTFTCKAIQEGHMGGKTWRLGFLGEKSIAKMYATPDGGIAVTYIDNGSEPIFVMRPTNNDGQTAVYTLSLCSEM